MTSAPERLMQPISYGKRRKATVKWTNQLIAETYALNCHCFEYFSKFFHNFLYFCPFYQYCCQQKIVSIKCSCYLPRIRGVGSDCPLRHNNAHNFCHIFVCGQRQLLELFFCIFRLTISLSFCQSIDGRIKSR